MLRFGLKQSFRLIVSCLSLRPSWTKRVLTWIFASVCLQSLLVSCQGGHPLSGKWWSPYFVTPLEYRLHEQSCPTLEKLFSVQEDMYEPVAWWLHWDSRDKCHAPPSTDSFPGLSLWCCLDTWCMNSTFYDLKFQKLVHIVPCSYKIEGGHRAVCTRYDVTSEVTNFPTLQSDLNFDIRWIKARGGSWPSVRLCLHCLWNQKEATLLRMWARLLP